jgi:mono/diheme cytochrome c family protein
MNWAFWKSKEKDHNKDVTVPPGNSKKGKLIYDEHCGGCHDLDVNIESSRATPKV